MKRTPLTMKCLLGCCLLLAANLNAEPAGEIALDFILKNRATGEDLSLYEFEGSIIVLDFFAYWCGPCQTSSPELEEKVAKFYEEEKGNPAGIPVVVIGVNIEMRNSASTDQFVTNSGMSLVGDDTTSLAWSRYSLGFIPHFAVINGVSGANFKQWEVLHSNYGYRGANFYKQIVDQVEYSEITPDSYEDWVGKTGLPTDEMDPDSDPDKDGRLNLYEYASGTDPLSSISQSDCNCENNGNGTLSLHYTMANETQGIVDRIEYSPDMINWSEYPEENGLKIKTEHQTHIEIEFIINHTGPDSIFLRRVVEEVE